MTDMMNIFILGLLYGFTICSLSCMPYLAPYAIGAGGGFSEGVKGSVTFVSGKIFTYSLLGGIAAYFGNEVITLNTNTVSYMLGAVLVAVGVSMLRKKKKGSCSDSRIKKKIIRQYSGRLPLFTLGVMTSLLPCLPLSALFLMAANSGIIYKGAAYGFLFGSGLIISPIILAGGFLGFLSGRLGMEMPDMKSFMKVCSAVMMIFMGGVEFLKGFYF
jgi:thiol:disulfide interchange protein DsbD